VANSATVPFANLGQPDVAPQTLITPFGKFTIAGSVVSSNPGSLEPAGTSMYFSASNGTSGVELWKTDGVDGTPAHTSQVKDIVAGSGGSYPWQMTPIRIGSTIRLLFPASGGLWVTDGTSDGTVQLKVGTVTYPYPITAAGDHAYFVSNGLLWRTDGTEENTVVFDKLIPPPAPLQVYVLAGEGDSLSSGDLTARTVPMQPALPWL
jgi:ELWxxDGT repeat protein